MGVDRDGLISAWLMYFGLLLMRSVLGPVAHRVESGANNFFFVNKILTGRSLALVFVALRVKGAFPLQCSGVWRVATCDWTHQ